MIRHIFRKDIALGPRSPFLLWALVLPVVLTLVIRVVFGSLFDSEPRLGVVDLGNSAVRVAAENLDGIRVSIVADTETLKSKVESGDLDAGLVLQEDFDDLVANGDQPPLGFWMAGESLASDRIILGVTALDLIRTTSGIGSDVAVNIVPTGDEGLELSIRLLPLVVIMAVAVAGAMVPAASLVQEKERRTLSAMLVSPASMRDILAAKGILGVVMAVFTGVITLLMNDAFGQQAWTLVLAIALGGVMMAEIGLMLGSWAPDTNTLFTAWKGGSILLLFPVIFTIWPTLPQWIAQLGPTYYFLQPIFDLSVNGASTPDVLGQLAIAAVICVALLPFVGMAGRSLERRLAGQPRRSPG